MMRVAVFGASGFVGTTLVERLVTGGHEVRPLIRSAGKAWRLARWGLPLESVDVLDRGRVADAVAGCTHVVNCVFGTEKAMIRGARNIVAACRAAGIQRYVHLSSVAVYGDPPPPQSVVEDAPTHPEKGSYGWVKLEQDKIVAAACRSGLPSIILCPPVISGVYSHQLMNLVASIRQGRFALVDDGSSPCNLVDVHNLAKAIELALCGPRGDGRRYFITDDSQATWRQLAEALLPLAGDGASLRSVTRAEAERLAAPPRRRISPMATLRHLMSRDVRGALRGDPLLARVEGGLRRVARGTLPEWAVQGLRGRNGRPRASRGSQARDTDTLSLSRQLRMVRHSCQRAKAELDYEPERDFAASMARFTAWYHAMQGLETGYGDLLCQLA